MRSHALVAVLLVALAACSRSPPDADELALPAEQAGFASVTTRYVVTDDEEAQARGLPPLERANVTSAAEYLYAPSPQASGRVTVRVEVFADESAAQAAWETRYTAKAGTQAFDAGDEGWIWEDQMAGVRVGPVILESRARGKVAGFALFCRSYGEFVRGELER